MLADISTGSVHSQQTHSTEFNVSQFLCKDERPSLISCWNGDSNNNNKVALQEEE